MADYRFDEDFHGFLKDFGEPHDSTPIPGSVIETYRDKLPQQLFVYWRALGACGFHNGLLWMVNPAEHQGLLDIWLDGSPFESRTDLSVIARTAFGLFHVWGKSQGKVMSIDPNVNVIFYNSENGANKFTESEENFDMRCHWGFQDPKELDEIDEDEKPLFARALKKLGALKSNEMYGYKHRLASGGKETLQNLEIVKLDVYHNIAQQMEPRQVITVT